MKVLLGDLGKNGPLSPILQTKKPSSGRLSELLSVVTSRPDQNPSPSTPQHGHRPTPSRVPCKKELICRIKSIVAPGTQRGSGNRDGRTSSHSLICEKCKSKKTLAGGSSSAGHRTRTWGWTKASRDKTPHAARVQPPAKVSHLFS